jgi:hypothetical protein
MQTTGSSLDLFSFLYTTYPLRFVTLLSFHSFNYGFTRTTVYSDIVFLFNAQKFAKGSLMFEFDTSFLIRLVSEILQAYVICYSTQ